MRLQKRIKGLGTLSALGSIWGNGSIETDNWLTRKEFKPSFRRESRSGHPRRASKELANGTVGMKCHVMLFFCCPPSAVTLRTAQLHDRPQPVPCRATAIRWHKTFAGAPAGFAERDFFFARRQPTQSSIWGPCQWQLPGAMPAAVTPPVAIARGHAGGNYPNHTKLATCWYPASNS